MSATRREDLLDILHLINFGFAVFDRYNISVEEYRQLRLDGGGHVTDEALANLLAEGRKKVEDL